MFLALKYTMKKYTMKKSSDNYDVINIIPYYTKLTMCGY